MNYEWNDDDQIQAGGNPPGVFEMLKERPLLASILIVRLILCVLKVLAQHDPVRGRVCWTVWIIEVEGVMRVYDRIGSLTNFTDVAKLRRPLQSCSCWVVRKLRLKTADLVGFR